jgi:hypothetical protein
MVKNGTRRGEWGRLAWLQSLRDVRDQIGGVTKLNQNWPIPPAAPPVHHNSGSMRSTPVAWPAKACPGGQRADLIVSLVRFILDLYRRIVASPGAPEGQSLPVAGASGFVFRSGRCRTAFRARTHQRRSWSHGGLNWLRSYCGALSSPSKQPGASHFSGSTFT